MQIMGKNKKMYEYILFCLCLGCLVTLIINVQKAVPPLLLSHMCHRAILRRSKVSSETSKARC